MSKPNYSVTDAINREVPIWSQVHSMSSKDIRYGRGNLKENGFNELELEKDHQGVYVLPWWMKPCVLGRQYMRPNKGLGRSLIVFQLFEFMGQVIQEIWNGKETKTEIAIVSTGIHGLAFINGPWIFYRTTQ